MFSFDGNAIAADVSQITVFTRVPPMIKAVQAIFVGDEISVTKAEQKMMHTVTLNFLSAQPFELSC